MDADPSENPADLTEDKTPHTFVAAPSDEQREHGSVATFVYRAPEGWTAAGTVAQTVRGLAIQRLELDPAEPDQGVTARMLRTIPLSEILATAATSRPVLEAVERLHANEPPQAAREPGRPGRAPLSDDLLRQVATLYLEETAPGKPRRAVQRVAERMGNDAKTLSRWVFQARRRGWLGPATPGREGSPPGPLLLQAWQDEADPNDVEARRRVMEGIFDLTEAQFGRRAE